MLGRAVWVALGLLTVTVGAHAGPGEVVALPAASASDSAPDGSLEPLLARLDQLVSEAVQDLGLTLALEPRGPRRSVPDEALVARAPESWVVMPTLAAEAGALRLRLIAVRPHSRVLLTRSELVPAEELDVRVAVMMQDLVSAPGETASASNRSVPGVAKEPGEPGEPRSSGRAVLALNAAVFGGYVGYSMQRASGSADARLVYPLVALGTGVGLGASMLVADEWDVSLGDAWFLSAGLWWPASSGLLLAASHDVPTEDRYVYGVVFGAGGAALATAAVSLTRITEGDAALAHSGGAFGLGLGGLTQLFIEGHTRSTPLGGMGYGAAFGTLGAGVLAVRSNTRASRVLLIDLGATLGAMTGAAAASPLLLVDEEESVARTRLWLGSIFAGSVLGAGIGWLSTGKVQAKVADEEPRPPAFPYAFAVPEGGSTRVEAGVSGRF